MTTRPLHPKARPGNYVFLTQPIPGITPEASIVEDEGTTYIVESRAADAAGVTYHETFAWITLTTQTDLTEIGITARFATALATAGIPGNVLAGYYHDHLLVPTDRLEEALTILGEL